MLADLVAAIAGGGLDDMAMPENHRDDDDGVGK